MVDDARNAYRFRNKLKATSLDLIFCDMVTYATSATFGGISARSMCRWSWWRCSR